MAGERFGPYRIEELLGRGSMGEVHRATDVRKERAVALKRLNVAHGGDEGFVARFRREAEMTARLNEPHVIPIHDYGEVDGQLYLDMRLVEGVDLGLALSTNGPMEPMRAVAIVEQVAAALDAAHRAGLVHRDVKPSNILLARSDGPERGAQLPEFAYLIDFGIAASLNDARLTSQSTLIGTAAYMAPERFQPGVGGDHRVDVYALGCVLHEALAGGAPFAASSGSIEQLMYAHLHQPPPRPGALRGGLPPALDEVVATAMHKEPDHRYQHAGALAAAARAAVSGSPSTGRSASPAPPPPPPVAAPTPTPTAAPTPAPAPAPDRSASTTPALTAPTAARSVGPGPAGTQAGPVASTDEFARPALPQSAPGAPPPSAPPRPHRRWPLLTAALLLALLVLGGTGYLLLRDYLPGWVPGAPSAAPSAPPAAPARLPDGLVGTWNGTQTETGPAGSFAIRVDLTPGAVGEKVGDMSFTVYDCRFELYLTAVAATVDLQARPVAGGCTEGTVRATVAGPDRFTYETVAGGQVAARGELDRG